MSQDVKNRYNELYTYYESINNREQYIPEDNENEDKNVTDIALFVQGSIAPSDVDWIRSCNHYFTCKNKTTYLPTIFCNGNVTIYNAYSKDKLFKFN